MKRSSSTTSTMSSDDEYRPARKINNAPRRSVRIARSDPKNFKPKPTKIIDEKIEKKSSRPGRKSTPRKKFVSRVIPEEKHSSNEFSSSYLTTAELQQLFMKFQRDGHFRLNERNVSPPPLVISRTTDGKFMTTKIECYQTSPQLVRDLTTSFAATRSETKVPTRINDPTSVTFSTPLFENTSGIALPTTTAPASFVSPTNKFSIPNNATNRPQKPSSYSLTSQRRNFVAGNEFFDNSGSSNFYGKSIASADTANVHGNGFATSSGPGGFCFANSGSHGLPSRTRASPVDPRNPQARGIDAQNGTNIYNGNNSNNQANNYNPANSKDFSHVNIEMPNFRYDNYSHFDAIGHHNASQHPRKFYPRSGNFSMENSSFDPFNKWNLPTHASSNPIGTHPSTIKTDGINAMPENPMNVNVSRILAHNSGFANIGDCMYNVQPNYCNSPIIENNGYHHSSIANWNNVPASQNSTYYDVYHGPGKCETATRPLIGDQTRIPSMQINSWAPFDNDEKNVFDILGDGTNDSTSTGLIDFPDIATIDENKTETGTESVVETGLPESNDERNDKSGFDFRQLPDSQNGELRPTVSSNGSFDDDISYDNYASDNILTDNNNNSEPTIAVDVFSTRALPSVTSIKTEMRSWYSDNNCRYANIGRSNESKNFGINDFDAKNEIVDSPDCFIIDDMSRS